MRKSTFFKNNIQYICYEKLDQNNMTNNRPEKEGKTGKHTVKTPTKKNYANKLHKTLFSIEALNKGKRKRHF